MRCFLLISNIDKIDLYMAGIKEHIYLYLFLYFGYFNALKSVLYIDKSAISQQIIFNKSVIIQKRSLMTIILIIRPNQVINKIYKTRLLSIKVLIIIKI